LRGFGITDAGKRRTENQDCFMLNLTEENEGSVFVVCDGMGGARAGDVASKLAAEAFMTFCQALLSMESEPLPEEVVAVAARQANVGLCQCSVDNPDCRGMGTTLVGGIYKSGRVALVNVGDSRAYLIKDSAIERVTTDHSLVEELVSHGALTREQARDHPRKNVVTRALGVDPNVAVDVYTLDFNPGELLILCSDGLSNTMTDGEILGLAMVFPEPETLCHELLGLALQRGAPDNVTAVAIAI